MADTRLDDLARRIDSYAEVSSIYRAFHILASRDSRTPAQVDEMVEAINRSIDEIERRTAGT
ncbi:hypothetical protein [Rhodococcus sp. NPDC057529]|uniref:hypothetical protein n=1 Tax=Rhodococcus sp. NPDC057529 TaxID=3346158 RepID=UPI0036724E12